MDRVLFFAHLDTVEVLVRSAVIVAAALTTPTTGRTVEFDVWSLFLCFFVCYKREKTKKKDMKERDKYTATFRVFLIDS